MKNRIVKKMTRLLFVGFLLGGMIYTTSTLATSHVSAATCDCSSLASAATFDCYQRFGNSAIYPIDCSASGGELSLFYFCWGDPEQQYIGEQHCQL